MEICDRLLCTGCGACFNICKKNAISMLPDKEGFLYPVIENKSCVRCGACVQACPSRKELSVKDFEKKVYSCWLKNPILRKESTSGGAFSAIATTELNEGIVFGAGFDQNNKVVHKAIDSVDKLKDLRGSKYVQSDIGNSYILIRKLLSEGRKVLFSGTPCQIAGLYSFLGSRHVTNLLTIDVVCHGVPSPLIYEEYKKYMESLYHSKIKRINFRYKKPSWFVFSMRIEFENGRIYCKNTYKDPYLRGFLRELDLRPSCHNCKYANLNRVADITLADFWRYKKLGDADRDDDKGISMVMINTQKGEAAFQRARHYLHFWPRTIDDALLGNRSLSEPFPPSPQRMEFWDTYSKKKFSTVLKEFLYPEKMPMFAQKRLLLNRIPTHIRKMAKTIKRIIKF